MVVGKVVEAGKWTLETIRGAAVTLASPNAPIPETKLHPRMPARPWTAPEWFRMTSWRHIWMYAPVFRYYIYSGIILYGAFKLLVPLKPRHKIMYTKGKDEAHHHEVEHWAGFRQKLQDKEYFRRRGEAVEGGH
ncbi:CRE-RIL-1 protein [Aphelenchoides fujianensis]|nr:CRE-RIL-1 protein [Aphelenchoides fujianensis]KAI6225467.1 CRE-RIL-1 protein [Aphelenchoides fujianensis]